MNCHEFEQPYLGMRSGVESGGKDLEKMQDALFHAAARYAALRVRWRLATVDERDGIDAERTRAHNVFIDCCNVLSRAMRRLELPTEWRKLIGDETTIEGRKQVGDYACYLSFVLGLEAR